MDSLSLSERLCEITEKLENNIKNSQEYMKFAPDDDFKNCDGNSGVTITLGDIQSTIGKSTLLIEKKFKQFKTLIEQSKENPELVTSSDLFGYWEVMNIQINQLLKEFETIEVEFKTFILPKDNNNV